MITGPAKINLYLSNIVGRRFGIADLYAAAQHQPALRAAIKAAADASAPAKPASPVAQLQQPQARTEQVPEQRPPSPRPAAWGNAILNDGGGAKWGDGAAPAKAEVPEAEPAAKSESSEPIKTFGSGSWG